MYYYYYFAATTPLPDRSDPSIEREATILTTVHDVLTWRHASELGMEKRI
jgi:hypothetical protein